MPDVVIEVSGCGGSPATGTSSVISASPGEIEFVIAGCELRGRALHAIVVQAILLVDPEFEVAQLGLFGIGGLLEVFGE